MTEHTHIRAIREAAAKLIAFADQAHKISVWNVDGSDLRQVGKDLGYIAAEIIDPLILAYGEYAGEHSYYVDPEIFRSVCSTAMDGDCLYEIRAAADRIREELMEDAE